MGIFSRPAVEVVASPGNQRDGRVGFPTNFARITAEIYKHDTPVEQSENSFPHEFARNVAAIYHDSAAQVREDVQTVLEKQ